MRNNLSLFVLVLLLLSSLASGQQQKSIIVCESTGPGTITCPLGQNIDIVNIIYGRTHALPITTCNPYKSQITNFNCVGGSQPKNHVNKKCQGKSTCSVENSWKTLGDPCSGVPKFLKIDYQCIRVLSQQATTGMPTPTAMTRKTTICETKHATFTCPTGKVLHITNVLWGRLQNAPVTLCNPYHIPVAGVHCNKTPTATQHVESICNGKPSCVVANDWTKLGPDPCNSIPKYLQVSYQCDISPPTVISPTTRTTTFPLYPNKTTICETKHATFTCPTGKVLHITNVLWGRLPNAPVTLCNPYHTPVAGVHCNQTPAATHYVESICNGKSSCVVATDWTKLGPDPCIGIPKYLQVSYQCDIPPPTKLAQYKTTICEMRRATFTCPYGKVVHITNVLWGRLPNAPDTLCNPYHAPVAGVHCNQTPAATQHVESICNGMSSCVIASDWTKLGPDPCNSIPKYLQVSYQCDIPPPTVISPTSTDAASRSTTFPPDSNKRTICEAEHATFTCPTGKVLHITNVLWGRLPNAPATLCNPYKTPVVGAHCKGGPAATQHVESVCNGKSSCVVANDWTKLGPDPCSGIPKYLQVSYQCAIPPPSVISPSSTDAASQTTLFTPEPSGGCISDIKHCAGRPVGTYQSCNDCTHYITCAVTGAWQRPCPTNLKWDNNVKRCKLFSSTCHGRSLPEYAYIQGKR